MCTHIPPPLTHHVDVHVRQVGYEVISYQEPHEDPVIQYLLQIIAKGEFPLLCQWAECGVR